MREELHICTKHFEDKNIKSLFSSRSNSGYCSYCKRNKQVISIKELAEVLEEFVQTEYDDPYSRGAIYNKEAVYYEDRFPGVTVEYTSDVLERELEVDDYKVIEDLSREFGNDYWAEIDGIWGNTQDEYLKGGWQQFKEIIKHKIRFVFFNQDFEKDFEDSDSETINPYFILQEVKNAINTLDLYKVYPKGKMSVFRGRQHSKGEPVNSAFHLGSPPPNIAKANRMSPAGISMFYGAFDIDTAEKEIIDESWKDSIITFGKFTNLKELTLVDFTKLKQIPSLFDTSNRKKRPIAKFLNNFIRDLSIPVKPDNSVHIEYVPTQVVTEYIKYILGKEKSIDGIIYNSVKNKGGKCVVLFIENRDSCDKYEIISEPSKELKKALKGFGFDKSDNKFDIKTIATLMLDNKKFTIKEIPTEEPE